MSAPRSLPTRPPWPAVIRRSCRRGPAGTDCRWSCSSTARTHPRDLHRYADCSPPRASWSSPRSTCAMFMATPRTTRSRRSSTGAWTGRRRERARPASPMQGRIDTSQVSPDRPLDGWRGTTRHRLRLRAAGPGRRPVVPAAGAGGGRGQRHAQHPAAAHRRPAADRQQGAARVHPGLGRRRRDARPGPNAPSPPSTA